MKRILYLLIIALIAVSCSEDQEPAPVKKDQRSQTGPSGHPLHRTR
jgi:PBP1b-binding outer membrane lipoprotein LpoB